MTTYRIRPETALEGGALRVLTETAFAPMSFSNDDEGEALDRLRRDGDLSLSLVAEAESGLVGHVAMSPATVGGEVGWFGLGPISVKPEHQRIGIGSALMREAIAWARERGAKGVVLTGNPACYSRFGFVNEELTHLDVPRTYVMYLTFGDAPSGEVTFSPALQETT